LEKLIKKFNETKEKRPEAKCLCIHLQEGLDNGLELEAYDSQNFDPEVVRVEVNEKT